MKVLDASFSRLPAGWAAARKAEGYGAFIQCLWTGGYANNPITVAESNLRQAREAGLIPCGYINTNPWFPAETSIREAKKNAGAEWQHLPIVFNDIEIAGVTEAQCKAHTEAIIAEGKRTAIYSAKWFWDSIGNPKWPWLKQYGAWVADYDGDPNIATTTLFGPFTVGDVVGKQYTNTTDVAGVQVDINEFRDSFFQEDDMGIAEHEQHHRDNIDPYLGRLHDTDIAIKDFTAGQAALNEKQENTDIAIKDFVHQQAEILRLLDERVRGLEGSGADLRVAGLIKEIQRRLEE